MIYKGFVAETTSKMTYEEVVKFFSTTKDDALPVILIALDDDVFWVRYQFSKMI